MPRVLHVLNTYRLQIGGGGEHLLRLATGLAGRGYSSAVVIGEDGPIGAQLRTAGLSVVTFGRMNAATTLRLGSLFRTMRPDLLHLHGSRAGIVGVLATRLSGTHPVIYTAHAFAFKRQLPVPLRRILGALESVTCASADRVICLTHGDIDAARRYGIRLDRVAVIPNGVDVTRFDHGEDRRREFGFPPAAPVVGMVARLVRQKDPLAFVAVAQRVLESERAAVFLLVGDGPLRPAVEQAIRRQNLTGRVVVTGFRQDIPALLQTMDVVVLTSRWEGLPFVVLEAMAASRPVVATRLSGTAEVIVDGLTGRLVPVGDVPHLADAVVELLRDPQRRAEMGLRGRARVGQEFSLAQMIEKTAATYEAARAAPRGGIACG